MTRTAQLLVCSALVATSGCAEQKLDLPSGEQAYARMPATSATQQMREYAIGPLDRLNITVFGERDLSTEQAQVDAAGDLSLPLVGRVTARGKTAGELSTELKQRLAKYLVDPQVSVLVLSSVSQKVTVEGSVNEAGVYPIQGRSTLLEMLAMAKGASGTSDERRVAVFRTVDGQRMGALFDVTAIESGTAPDPELHGGDVVIVGHSPRRGVWHDFLVTAPALGLFVALANAI